METSDRLTEDSLNKPNPIPHPPHRLTLCVSIPMAGVYFSYPLTLGLALCLALGDKTSVNGMEIET